MLYVYNTVNKLFENNRETNNLLLLRIATKIQIQSIDQQCAFWSVFSDSSREWKLGGLEYVSNVDGNQIPPIKLPVSLEIYDPPEKNDVSKLKLATKW